MVHEEEVIVSFTGNDPDNPVNWSFVRASPKAIELLDRLTQLPEQEIFHSRHRAFNNLQRRLQLLSVKW